MIVADKGHLPGEFVKNVPGLVFVLDTELWHSFYHMGEMKASYGQFFQTSIHIGFDGWCLFDPLDVLMVATDTDDILLFQQLQDAFVISPFIKDISKADGLFASFFFDDPEGTLRRFKVTVDI
jgi:hypothetical protein